MDGCIPQHHWEVVAEVIQNEHLELLPFGMSRYKTSCSLGMYDSTQR